MLKLNHWFKLGWVNHGLNNPASFLFQTIFLSVYFDINLRSFTASHQMCVCVGEANNCDAHFMVHSSHFLHTRDGGRGQKGESQLKLRPMQCGRKGTQNVLRETLLEVHLRKCKLIREIARFNTEC